MIHSIKLFFPQPKLPNIRIFIKSGVSIVGYSIIFQFFLCKDESETDNRKTATMGIIFAPSKWTHWVALSHTSCYKQYQ